MLWHGSSLQVTAIEPLFPSPSLIPPSQYVSLALDIVHPGPDTLEAPFLTPLDLGIRALTLPIGHDHWISTQPLFSKFDLITWPHPCTKTSVHTIWYLWTPPIIVHNNILILTDLLITRIIGIVFTNNENYTIKIYLKISTHQRIIPQYLQIPTAPAALICTYDIRCP